MTAKTETRKAVTLGFRVLRGGSSLGPAASSKHVHDMERGAARGSEGQFKGRRFHYEFLAWYGLFWSWMAVAPLDRRDWLLENVLALMLVAVLILTYRRLRFSTVSYCLSPC